MVAERCVHSFRGKTLTYWERRKPKSGMPRSRSVSYWQSWGRNPGFFGSGTNASLGRNRLCWFPLQTQTCKVTANVTIHIRDAVFGSNGSHPLFLPEKKKSGNSQSLEPNLTTCGTSGAERRVIFFTAPSSNCVSQAPHKHPTIQADSSQFQGWSLCMSCIRTPDLQMSHHYFIVTSKEWLFVLCENKNQWLIQQFGPKQKECWISWKLSEQKEIQIE